ncbi:myosin-9-like [Dysidea avara]|uniref:myosin-9-like n=1 Tax=Dysidea avara TaxID=196820 RepID=UPI00332E2349
MAAESMKYLAVDRASYTDALAQAEWASKKLVWVPDKDHGFVQGQIKNEKGDEIEVQLEAGGKKVVNRDDLQKMNPPKFEKVEDMAELACLNEASVLHNLRNRYYSGLIYTYSGLFCVVVNPYKWLPIYSDNVVDMYKGKKRHEMPPHVYAIADAAYRNMLQDRENQSILCTGESGAGKTENTKKVIQYLAKVAGGTKTYSRASLKRRTSITLQTKAGLLDKQGDLEAQLLQANPILEAFGNAKTVKNDNSSRFGKFIRINFDNSGHIIGANIETYLLEKSRTVHQANDERIFHFFYQMLNGADAEKKKEYLLEAASQFSYLSNGNLQVQGVNDSDEYSDTMEAMSVMGMTDDEKAAVHRVTSAVLHFGNLKFKQERNSDQAVLPDNTSAQKICKLLGISVTEFTKALLKPRIKTGRDYTVRSQNKEQVEFSSQALSKALYERMFKWIVQRINKSLGRISRQGSTFIGILDIAGFEIFKLNSFEQICINYTNEKLQQLFNHTMFILEQEEYRLEGIDWNFIDFGLDLQPCIDLIEKPMGILSLLDEECWFPKATDKTYVDKLHKEHLKNAKYKKPDFRSAASFSVVHYAGTVDYNTEQWIMKNMDPLNDNIVQLFANSSDWFLSTIWKDQTNIVGITARGGEEGTFGAHKPRKGMFRTVSQLYKEQLNKLMETLRATNPNFVRCIIPNHEKKPNKIVAPLVLEQLKCNGVLEGIRICRQGFPNRILFPEFRQRYEILTPGIIPKGFMDGKKATEKMLQALDLDPSHYRIGHSKVFFRAGVLAKLEEDRDIKLTGIIISLQACIRGLLGRRAYLKRVEQSRAMKVIQSNIRSYLKLRNWPWWRLFTKVKPLLQVTNQEEERRQMETEIKRLNDRYEKLQTDHDEMKNKNEQLNQEQVALQEELAEEKFMSQEAEEMRNLLSAKKAELENMLVESEAALEQEEERVHNLNTDKAKLQLTITNLEEQLAEEGTTNQKLQHEKIAAEGKIKTLEEQLTVSEDSIIKLSHEKKNMEGKLAELQDALTSEENKSKQEHRQRMKLEQTLADLEAKLEREMNLRAELEKEKRKLQAEIAELQDQLHQARAKIDDLTSALNRTQKELTEMTAKAEEEAAARAKAEKQCRDLSTQVSELQDDLDSEKDAKSKVEKMRKQLNDELEGLRVMLEESEGSAAAQQEIRGQRETELMAMKRTLEEDAASHESAISAMRQKYSHQIEDLNEQLESSRKTKSSLEKTKQGLELDRSVMEDEIKELTTSRGDLEKKKKALEGQVMELQARVTEDNNRITELQAVNTKLQTDLATANNQFEDIESKYSTTEKQRKGLQQQLTETQEMLAEETRLKMAVTNKQKQLADEVEHLKFQLEEEEDSKQQLQNRLIQLTQQVSDAKKIADDDQAQLEEAMATKKKQDKELEALQERIDELQSENNKLSKGKKKLQEELDDLNINYDTQRNSLISLEKKQKKFDNALAEEKAISEHNAQERDAAESRARQAETKSLSVTRELEEVLDKLAESERSRKQLQSELDNLMESKDDVGKSVADLEKAKRMLEAELEEQKQAMEELEDELQIVSDAKLRLEVNIQAAKSNYERDLQSKDEQVEEVKRSLTKQVRDLETQAEDERKQRSSATSAMKKLEADLAELESQRDLDARGRDDAYKQYKKLQTQLKDAQQEANDTRASQDELSSRLKEAEKKWRNLDVELQQAQEALASAERARRTAEQERDDLQDEASSSGPKVTQLTEEKRRLENRIVQLEEDLDEEQNNAETSADKYRKALQQVDSMNLELQAAQSREQKATNTCSTLERQVKDLRSKVEELEASGGRRLKAQVSNLEAKISSLEDQLETISRDKQQTQRTLRRQDKKIKEYLTTIEDERRTAEQYKEQSDKANSKLRSLKRQVEEMDEENSRITSTRRRLQRDNEELVEQIDTLNREVATLKSRNTGRSSRYGGSISGSSSRRHSRPTTTDDSVGDDSP